MKKNTIKIYPAGNDELRTKKKLEDHLQSFVPESILNINDFVYCKTDVDIIIVTQHIYENYFSYKKFISVKKRNPKSITIQICGEAFYPDLNAFDYAIGYPALDLYNNNYKYQRIPFGLFFSNLLEKIETSDLSCTKQELYQRKFCNFIYSNPNSHIFRDNFFTTLSKYKSVDSLGRHLNNVKNLNTGYYGVESILKSIDIKGNYKFSIAIENAYMPGYTTEKVITSILGKTIPIYWGNPLISKYINSERIINLHAFESIESAIEHIKKIDKNDYTYLEIVNKPIFTNENKLELNDIKVKYNEFWKNIMKSMSFNSETNKSTVTNGTFMDITYKNWFYKKRQYYKNSILFRTKKLYNF